MRLLWPTRFVENIASMLDDDLAAFEAGAAALWLREPVCPYQPASHAAHLWGLAFGLGQTQKTKLYSELRRRRMRVARARGTHTHQQWVGLCAIFNHQCAACSRAAALTKDHIIPVSRGGSDAIGNLQPLCQRCNSVKFTRDISFVARKAKPSHAKRADGPIVRPELKHKRIVSDEKQSHLYWRRGRPYARFMSNGKQQWLRLPAMSPSDAREETATLIRQVRKYHRLTDGCNESDVPPLTEMLKGVLPAIFVVA